MKSKGLPGKMQIFEKQNANNGSQECFSSPRGNVRRDGSPKKTSLCKQTCRVRVNTEKRGSELENSKGDVNNYEDVCQTKRGKLGSVQ